MGILRESPSLRSVAYLGGAAVILRLTVRLYGLDAEWSPAAIHLTTIPLVAGLTRAFVLLSDEDKVRWNRVPVKQGVGQFVIGQALGASAFLAVVGIAYARGWAHLPLWGWECTSPAQVVRMVLLSGLRHGAGAWNEEMVFRGYGLDTVTAAIGRPIAVASLVALFARAHGGEWQVLLGQSALGLALTSLRLTSDSLWVPVGYHFAWNIVQTAVLGPPEWPSLRPLHVDGPYVWMGRPGYPEPGLLTALVNLVIAVGAMAIRQRKVRR